MKWHAATIGFLTFLFYLAARADVPPEPGYLRQTVSITFDTKDDVSDYRFFIESPMRIDEIKIAKGEPSVVDGTGRVGVARVGTLWAIPRKTVADEFGVSGQEKLEYIRKVLSEGRMYSAVKLLTLDFQATIREAEKANWKDPVYSIEKKGDQTLSAVLVSGGKSTPGNQGPGFGVTSYSRTLSPFGWAIVGGGVVAVLGLLLLGFLKLGRRRFK